MPSLGTTEIILIVLVLLLLFGGKKIPEMMRGLGTGMKEFKKATNSDDEAAQAARRDDRYLDDRRVDDARVDDRRSEPRVGEPRPGDV